MFWNIQKNRNAVSVNLCCVAMCSIPEADWLAPGGQSAMLLISLMSPLPDPPLGIFTVWGSPTSRKGHSGYQGRAGSLCLGATRAPPLSWSLFSTWASASEKWNQIGFRLHPDVFRNQIYFFSIGFSLYSVQVAFIENMEDIHSSIHSLRRRGIALWRDSKRHEASLNSWNRLKFY